MNRILIAGVALAALLGLGLQFGITLGRNVAFGILAGIGDFLSFFTIQTHIVLLLVAAATATRWPGILTRPGVQAAAALYIFVVMLIYHAILRGQWDPQGLVWFATTMLHYIVPLLYLFWWVAYADKTHLTPDLPVKWLGFPVAFLLLSLGRGAITGWYPYSFLDVAEIGYPLALRNAAMIAGVFLLAGYALVFLGQRRSANSSA